MIRGNRPRNQHFEDDEKLYRRFRPDMVDGRRLELDAVCMPDMSVMRESLMDDMRWVLIDPDGQRDFSSWGIAYFRVEDVPCEVLFRGAQLYIFGPRHVPLPRNYPHSEVWAYRDGEHLQGRNALPPEVHLTFRERLLQRTRIAVRPTR